MPVALFLFFCWALTIVAVFFRPIFLLPDVLMLAMLYLFYFSPQVKLWRYLLPISLLMDLAAQVVLGFHGILYLSFAIIIFPLRPYWQVLSLFEQVMGIICTAVGFQILRYLFLYLIEGIPAPAGWYWTILLQIIIWPFMRRITEWFSIRYLPREPS